MIFNVSNRRCTATMRALRFFSYTTLRVNWPRIAFRQPRSDRTAHVLWRLRRRAVLKPTERKSICFRIEIVRVRRTPRAFACPKTPLLTSDQVLWTVFFFKFGVYRIYFGFFRVFLLNRIRVFSRFIRRIPQVITTITTASRCSCFHLLNLRVKYLCLTNTIEKHSFYLEDYLSNNYIILSTDDPARLTGRSKNRALIK